MSYSFFTLMIPWSTPQILGNSPKLHHSCFQSKWRYLPEQPEHKSWHHLELPPKTSNSTFTELPNNTTSIILWRVSQAPSTPEHQTCIIWSPDIVLSVIQLLCFIFGCFPTLLMSLVFFSFILKHLVMYLSLLLPSDTVFLKIWLSSILENSSLYFWILSLPHYF